MSQLPSNDAFTASSWVDAVGPVDLRPHLPRDGRLQPRRGMARAATGAGYGSSGSGAGRTSSAQDTEGGVGMMDIVVMGWEEPSGPSRRPSAAAARAGYSVMTARDLHLQLLAEYNARRGGSGY